MQGENIAFVVNYHGTMSANARGEWTVPFDLTLTHVSFGNSAASDATLDIGDSTDRNGVIAAGAIGDSGTPAEFGADDFNGALATAGTPYKFRKGTILTWDIDYDGSSGTAAANATLVLTFGEG